MFFFASRFSGHGSHEDTLSISEYRFVVDRDIDFAVVVFDGADSAYSRCAGWNTVSSASGQGALRIFDVA